MLYGYSYGGGGCCCVVEWEELFEQCGLVYGLYLCIDLEWLQCFNESCEGSGCGVFKLWEEWIDCFKFVESDVDEEFLFNILFMGNVKFKGIIIMGEDDDLYFFEMRLYKNILQMFFDDIERELDQIFSLNWDFIGELEYVIKIFCFLNVYYFLIYILKNFGVDMVKVFYIGLRGEWIEFC